MRRGDVVLFVAQGDIGKARPGIVVQADELGDTTTSILVCPMSSDLTDVRLTRPVVQPAQGNGLRAASHVMTDKLLALRRDRIRSVIGRIDAATTERIKAALLVVLGLAR